MTNHADPTKMTAAARRVGNNPWDRWSPVVLHHLGNGQNRAQVLNQTYETSTEARLRAQDYITQAADQGPAPTEHDLNEAWGV